MWNDLKKRQCAFYQVYATPERQKEVHSFLEANKAKYRSRSALIQAALLEKLERDKPLLLRNTAIDPLRIASALIDRKAEEKRAGRRVMRWCLVLNVDVDTKVRKFLREYGARHGALCRFVDDALVELMDPTKRRQTATKKNSIEPSHDILDDIPLPMIRTPVLKDFGVGHHT